MLQTLRRSNVIRNLPLTVSAAALACLFYNGENDYVMGLLTAAVLAVFWMSFRLEGVWKFLRKNCNGTVVILTLVTVVGCGFGFFRAMAGNGLIHTAAQLLGVGEGKLAAATGAAGSLAATLIVCLGWEWLDNSARRWTPKPVENALNVETGRALKGAMIVVMVVHHTFGYPDWYLPEIRYPGLLESAHQLEGMTKLCVGVFAFLTGYAYARHKDQSLGYSLRKIRGFYGSYLLALAVLLTAALVFCGYRPTVSGLALELLTVNNEISMFNWYVHFYILSILLLPAAMGYAGERGVLWEAVGFGLVWSLTVVLRWLLPAESAAAPILKRVSVYFPCILSGFFLSRYRSLDHLVSWAKRCLPGILQILLGMFLFGLAMYLRTRLHRPQVLDMKIQTDCFLAPVLVLGYLLVRPERLKWVRKLLGLLGTYSVEMWFLHAVFFADATRELFQPIAYLPKQPVLVVCWVLLLSLGGAAAMAKLRHVLQRRFL